MSVEKNSPEAVLICILCILGSILRAFMPFKQSHQRQAFGCQSKRSCIRQISLSKALICKQSAAAKCLRILLRYLITQLGADCGADFVSLQTERVSPHLQQILQVAKTHKDKVLFKSYIYWFTTFKAKLLLRAAAPSSLSFLLLSLILDCTILIR